jgi:hypothetical protein
MFKLTPEETDSLRSQPVISKTQDTEITGVSNLKSQSVTSSSWGGRRKLPHAFTEQGVAMLSSVLRSSRAVQVNIEVMRAFVRLRQQKYDSQFGIVFEAIRELMTPPDVPRIRSGSHVEASTRRRASQPRSFSARLFSATGRSIRRPSTCKACASTSSVSTARG